MKTNLNKLSKQFMSWININDKKPPIAENFGFTGTSVEIVATDGKQTFSNVIMRFFDDENGYRYQFEIFLGNIIIH